MEDRSVNTSALLLVFRLDRQRYALHLDAVERVVRAVAVTALPDAPEIVHGIINVQSRIVPVINMRKCFHHPEKRMGTSDQFIIAATAAGTFALVADAALEVLACPSAGVVPSGEILPHMERVEGVMILADGMVLISDLDKILALADEALPADWPKGCAAIGGQAGEGQPGQSHEL
ncbi:MAG: chemotaxis protein CheW [Geobacteraceae bacterium]|nr:chemotaxis protein CheW [Geobacteraceae bacterium]